MSVFNTELIEGSLGLLFRNNDKLNFKIEWAEIKKLAKTIFEILNDAEIEKYKTENKVKLFESLKHIDKNNLIEFYNSLLDKQFNIKDRFYMALQPLYEQTIKQNK